MEVRSRLNDNHKTTIEWERASRVGRALALLAPTGFYWEMNLTQMLLTDDEIEGFFATMMIQQMQFPEGHTESWLKHTSECAFSSHASRTLPFPFIRG